MFRIILAAAAAALLALGMGQSASAAEAGAANWTGFYVGLNGGGAWGRSKTESPISDCGPVGWCYIASVRTDINNQSARTLDASTFTGGAQAGYNFQYGSLVVGGEADFNAFNLRLNRIDSTFFTCCGPPGTANLYTNTASTSWLFTGRGRFGFASANWLFFGTGGVAITNFSYAHTYIEGTAGGGGGVETVSASATRTGYVIGGGLEYMWMGNWSLKAEYLHLDFGSLATATAPIGSAIQGSSAMSFNHTADLTADIVRVGLNYKFN